MGLIPPSSQKGFLSVHGFKSLQTLGMYSKS